MPSLKQIAKKYDVKYVTEWRCPDGGGAPIIAMPNIPRPLHLINPRNILGSTTWTHMRKACYAAADMTCEICGKKQDRGYCDCHELYDIDYEHGVSTFVRTICLCRKCHRYGIHSGRCITLFKNGNPLMTKEALLDGAENVFRLVANYNKKNPEADLRVYINFLEYLRCEELREPMEKLIEKYNIKFYSEDPKKCAKFGDWKLIIGTQEYPTPYENEKAWKKAMEEQEKKDTDRILQKNMDKIFSGPIYDELNKIIDASKSL